MTHHPRPAVAAAVQHLPPLQPPHARDCSPAAAAAGASMAAGLPGSSSLQSPLAAAPHPRTGTRAGRFGKTRGWGDGRSTRSCTGLRDWEANKRARFQSPRGNIKVPGRVGWVYLCHGGEGWSLLCVVGGGSLTENWPCV